MTAENESKKLEKSVKTLRSMGVSNDSILKRVTSICGTSVVQYEEDNYIDVVTGEIHSIEEVMELS